MNKEATSLSFLVTIFHCRWFIIKFLLRQVAVAVSVKRTVHIALSRPAMLQEERKMLPKGALKHINIWLEIVELLH